MAVFVYAVDDLSEPARERRPLRFTEVYLGHVTVESRSYAASLFAAFFTTGFFFARGSNSKITFGPSSLR